MSRYLIRDIETKVTTLGSTKFSIKDIQETVELLHYYDKKNNETSYYEVFDTKLNKVIWKEGV